MNEPLISCFVQPTPDRSSCAKELTAINGRRYQQQAKFAFKA